MSVIAEMNRTMIKSAQKEGIELAKLRGDVFLGRKSGTFEDPLKFLSKSRNRHAMDLLKKKYKSVEISKITGLHINTISKVKKLMKAI
jgi:DNA invertase Pin-like site-specific DNA recombinase